LTGGVIGPQLGTEQLDMTAKTNKWT